MDTILNFLFASFKAGTPLLFGTTGEIVTEKAGNTNLGVEGMMFMGAFMGFFVACYTDSLIFALLAAFLFGMVGALIYAYLTVSLRANQIVSGLALTIFGSGLANFFGQLMIANYKSSHGDAIPKLSERMIGLLAEKPLPLLSEIPWIGKVFFSHNILVYAAILVAILCSVYLNRTKFGLRMRAVGENAATADAAGISVTKTKYFHILLGGGICGLGGAYISLIDGGGVWNNNCVSGKGWIAVALVIFAGWKPAMAILGSFIFGAFTVLQFYVPKSVIAIPNAFYIMLPYLITAIVLVVTSMRKTNKVNQPKGCGNNYFREDR